LPDVGETQGELITKFPGKRGRAGERARPVHKADGTTGTDLYLSKDGQAAFAADYLHRRLPGPSGHAAAV